MVSTRAMRGKVWQVSFGNAIRTRYLDYHRLIQMTEDEVEIPGALRLHQCETATSLCRPGTPA